MKDIIWGSIGIVIAVAATVYLIKLLALKKKGIIANAEVTAVREGRKNSYIHTLRFGNGTDTWEKDDRSGFSHPMKVGDKRLIVYNTEDPGDFEYEDELKKNIIITIVMIAIALVFSAKWLISGLI